MSDSGQGGRPLRGPAEEVARTGWAARAHPVDGGPEWTAWTWASRGGSFSWLGVLLVVLGLALLVERLVPELSLTSLLILALGLAFGVAWLVRGVVGATAPALVLVAWAMARIGVELGILTGEGWPPLLTGAAFLIAWGLGPVQHARRMWALLLGIVVGLIGLADVLDALPSALDLEVLIPIAVMGLGLWLLFRRRTPWA